MKENKTGKNYAEIIYNKGNADKKNNFSRKDLILGSWKIIFEGFAKKGTKGQIKQNLPKRSRGHFFFFF